jgi:hypothetical protein
VDQDGAMRSVDGVWRCNVSIHRRNYERKECSPDVFNEGFFRLA